MVQLPGKARNAYLSIISDGFVLLTHPGFLQAPYVCLPSATSSDALDVPRIANHNVITEVLYNS